MPKPQTTCLMTTLFLSREEAAAITVGDTVATVDTAATATEATMAATTVDTALVHTTLLEELR